MAKNDRASGLVILTYDPVASTRDRNLLRSDALSHAARVSHARRKKEKRPQPDEHDDRTTSENRSLSQKVLISRARHRARVKISLGLGSLQQGNQDPFGSTAIRITPNNAYLMSTWREYLEFNPNDSTRWLSIADTERDFSLARESELNSKCLIFAASSALSSRFPHDENLKAIVSQNRRICLGHLKSIAISQADLPATTELANCLLLVFIGLCLSEALAEAKAYAGQLRKVLKHPDLWGKPALIAIWSRLYYDDMLFATRYFRPPLLDISSLTERWDPVLQNLRLWEARRLALPSKVVAPAFSKTLGELFKRLQTQVDIQSRNTLYAPAQFDARHMTGSLAVIIEIVYLLFDHWQLSQAALNEAREGPDRVKWHNEVKATLCALAFLANMIAGPKTPDGPDFQECGWRSMQALRYSLEQMPTLPSSNSDFWTYQHLQVWGYYLGAIWECEGGYTQAETWYTAQLRRKVLELGISSWDALKGVVDRFLRVPAFYAPGTVWFLGMSPMSQVADSSNLFQNKSSGDRLAEIVFT